MAEVILADCAGFCFGVKRAVDAVYENIEKGIPLYTYGPVVHNESVVADLESRGVRVIDSREELEALNPEEGAVIVIRAHGVAEEVYGLMEQKGTVLDLTCPFVKKIHRIVREESEKGKTILIAGNPDHPEVIGIRGWCRGESIVLETPEKAREFAASGALPSAKAYCLVAQTTFQTKKFQQIVDILAEKGYNDSVVNTICNATRERQEAAAALAKQADFMIVIGGRNSSNSRKLYDICVSECPDTVYIQTLDDLNLELPKSVRKVGITAGASTPQNIIEEVQTYVRTKFC